MRRPRGTTPLIWTEPVKSRSSRCAHTVAFPGDVGGLALEAFTTRWNAPGLRGIADHYRLGLRFTVGGEVVEHDLRYVLHEGEHWVDVNPGALPHAFHPDHQVTLTGNGGQPYVLTEAPAETRDRVLALYTAKYGPGHGAVLLRLTVFRSRRDDG